MKIPIIIFSAIAFITLTVSGGPRWIPPQPPAAGGGSTVTIEATATQVTGVNSGDSQNSSITVGSGANRGIIVLVAGADTEITTLVATGVSSSVDGAFTKIPSSYISGTAWVHVEGWYLLNPTAGAHTITVSYDFNTDQYAQWAVQVSGLNQTTPVGTLGSQGGAGTGMTAAVTLAAGDLALGIGMTDAEGSMSWTTGTIIGTITTLGSDTDVGVASNTGTGSVSITASTGNDNRALLVVPLKAAP